MSDTAQHLRMAEALLFAADEPLDNKSLAARLPEGADVPALMKELSERYQGRGVTLVKVAGKWAFRTAPDLAFLLEKERTVTRRLSKAAVETLAIVAYHQPVTRAEIEEIRGVGISRGTLDMLMEVGWVRLRGRRRTPGRPVTYGTTEDFLDHFGLEGLDDLPGVEELKKSGLLRAEPPTSLFPSHDENAEPEDTEPEDTEPDDGEPDDSDTDGGEPDDGAGPPRVIDPVAELEEDEEVEAQSAAPDGFNKAVAMSEEPHTEAAPRLAPSRRNGLAHEDPVVAGPAEPDSD
ncbi:MAG: SMC-Scp complex subunit ScpB [Proteobacteria bacterium]|nr:SMC-Scp complex subunit ScpB [Pseudomonadota bacterium]